MAQVGKKRLSPLEVGGNPKPKIYGGVVAPCTTPSSPEQVKIRYAIDLSLLERNIEREIMADKDKGQVISARDLYVRSNPGLLGTGQDVTNPREWYSSSAANSLIKALSDKTTDNGNLPIPKSGPNQSAVAFYVNFPNFSSSAAGFGPWQNGEGPERTKLKTERQVGDKGGRQAALPKIKQKVVWRENALHDKGLHEIHKKNLGLDHLDKENELNLQDGILSTGNLNLSKSQLFPPLRDTNENNLPQPPRKEDEDGVFSFPKLSRHDLVLPSKKPNKNSSATHLRAYLHQTLPEETLRQAQVRAGFVKNERKAITTNNSMDPVSFQEYTDKYMELRLPRSQVNEKNLHDTLHKTYHMKQKSTLKLKLTYEEVDKRKNLQRHRLEYDTGTIKGNQDYSKVKSKLGQYIKGDKQKKPYTKTRYNDERHGPVTSNSGLKPPKFSLGPQTNPITPLGKYHADNFPFVTDDAISHVEWENPQTPHSVKLSSATKQITNKSANNYYMGFQRERTKAAIVNISLSTPGVSMDEIRQDKLVETGHMNENETLSEATGFPHSSGRRSTGRKHTMRSDLDKLHPGPISTTSKTTNGQSVSVVRFRKLEVFGERQSNPTDQTMKQGETIESVRGSIDVYPPYVLDKADVGDMASDLSSHLLEIPTRRVSTITLGTDNTDIGTPKAVDGFPKSRSIPQGASNLRPKNTSMAVLVEKSFVIDQNRTKLQVPTKLPSHLNSNENNERRIFTDDQSRSQNSVFFSPDQLIDDGHNETASTNDVTRGNGNNPSSLSSHQVSMENDVASRVDLTKSSHSILSPQNDMLVTEDIKNNTEELLPN